jgi:hypothetical protein
VLQLTPPEEEEGRPIYISTKHITPGGRLRFKTWRLDYEITVETEDNKPKKS